MNKKHGITGPLSLKEPTQMDRLKSEIIHEYLLSSNFFEPLELSQTRERVLGQLNYLAQETFQGRIHTFGSYRLGVHQRNADIDTLMISPSKYSHKDFFTTFYKKLEANKEFECLQKIEDAYVPLIKFKIKNISIDLLFSRTCLDNLEKLNLLDDTLLKNMDDKSVLSINGSRVTDMLIELVPNKKVFHEALRCIKYWAKRRAVYGNAYGYYGGVAYAISVARICQFYPNAYSYNIIYKFFELYSNWEWPEPVLLVNNVDRNYNLKVWNPKVNYADKFHKMPVITPAYPSMCSTHNISSSTMNLIVAEFKRGLEVLKEVKELEKHYKSEKNCEKNILNNIETNNEFNHNNAEKSFVNENKQIEANMDIKTDISIIEKNQKGPVETSNLESSPDLPEDTNSTTNKALFNKLNSNQSEMDNENTPINECKNNESITIKNTININCNKNTSSSSQSFNSSFLLILKKLFLPSDFFKRYKFYLQVLITDEESWSGYIESKIRFLCLKLENNENYDVSVIVQAIPFPSGFKTKKHKSFFVAVEYKDKIKINIDKPVKEYIKSVNEWENRGENTIEIKILKKKEIGLFLKSYYEKINEKEKEDEHNAKRMKLNN